MLWVVKLGFYRAIHLRHVPAVPRTAVSGLPGACPQVGIPAQNPDRTRHSTPHISGD